MANWSLPSLISTYTNFVLEVAGRDTDCARWFSSLYADATNIPVGTVRWNNTAKNWEKWDGVNWNTKLSTTYGIDITGYAAHLLGGNNTTLLGSLGYQSNTNTTTLLSPNTTTTKKFLTQTGTGTNGAIPAWNGILDGDLPSALTGKTYNGNTWTAGTGVLTIAALKTLVCNNTLGLSGVDGSNIDIGAGGTLGTAAFTAANTYALLSGATYTGVITSSNATASSSKTTGAVIVAGGVGIGGDLYCGGNITAYATSDYRLKENIVNITNALFKVSILNGITFNWNELSKRPKDMKEAGLIAQEVQVVLPEVVVTRDDGYLAIRYEKVIPLLIEAIKELKIEIDTLKANK